MQFLPSRSSQPGWEDGVCISPIDLMSWATLKELQPRARQTWTGHLPPPSPPHPLACLIPALQGSPSLRLFLYKAGIIIHLAEKTLRDVKKREVLGTKRASASCVLWFASMFPSLNLPVQNPFLAHSLSWVSMGPGPQEGVLGLPLPAAYPSSMAAAALSRLGTSGGKVKATAAPWSNWRWQQYFVSQGDW